MFKKYVLPGAISKKDVRKIEYDDLYEFYERVSANEAITQKTLSAVKNCINDIFIYAKNKKKLSVMDTRGIVTKDLICKEVDNEDLIYSTEERSKILRVCAQRNLKTSRAIELIFCLGIRAAEPWKCALTAPRARRSKQSGGFRCLTGRLPSCGNSAANRRSASTFRMPRAFWSAVRMYEIGFTHAEIQGALGHLDPRTTDHYIRLARSKETAPDTLKWAQGFN